MGKSAARAGLFLRVSRSAFRRAVTGEEIAHPAVQVFVRAHGTAEMLRTGSVGHQVIPRVQFQHGLERRTIPRIVTAEPRQPPRV